MPPRPHFLDRYDAGRRLGLALRHHANDRPLVVLGLPRGGVPVAVRVAEALGAPLDVLVVRRLAAPGHEALAVGAVASGGARVIDAAVACRLGITERAIARLAADATRELARVETLYRGRQPFAALAGSTVILVDDGATSGMSLRLAIAAVRQLAPRAVVAAVPVASREARRLIEPLADEMACIVTPVPFAGVGPAYREFADVSDAEVRLLLADARRDRRTPPSGNAAAASRTASGVSRPRVADRSP